MHTKYVQKMLKVVQKRAKMPKISQKMKEKTFKNRVQKPKICIAVKT